MPVTKEARKVPKIANVTMAPKLEKNGFCKIKFIIEVIKQSNKKIMILQLTVSFI